MPVITSVTSCTRPGLLRRLGVAGLVFFLVKGLFWLAAPFLFLWLA
jgi:hypothetical protein